MYKSSIQAMVAQVEGLTSVYNAESQIYGEQVRGETSRITAQTAVRESDIRLVIAEAQLQTDILKANTTSMLTNKELVLKTMNDMAHVESQMIAAFTSSVAYSAGIHSGTTGSVSWTTSQSNQLSESWSHSL